MINTDHKIDTLNGSSRGQYVFLIICNSFGDVFRTFWLAETQVAVIRACDKGTVKLKTVGQ